MGFAKAKWVADKSDSSISSYLQSYLDAEITQDEQFNPEDTPEERQQKIELQLAKQQVMLGRLGSIKNQAASPEFKFLEEIMWHRVKRIDQREIWKALEEADEVKIINLRIERESIIQFVRKFEHVTEEYEAAAQDVKTLQDRLTPEQVGEADTVI